MFNETEIKHLIEQLGDMADEDKKRGEKRVEHPLYDGDGHGHWLRGRAEGFALARKWLSELDR